MTDARGDLIDMCLDPWITYERADYEEAIDAYAHELAAKVRSQQKEGHNRITCVPCFVYGEAARLIDPESEAT